MDEKVSNALKSDGDRYHLVNHDGVGTIADPLFDKLRIIHQVSPITSILEVGCSTGFRLEKSRVEFGAKCFGVEASAEAVNEGRESFPQLTLVNGVAPDVLTQWADETFDVVTLGHLLYLLPRESLFALAAQVDRLLRPGGHLLVEDFFSTSPSSSDYRHTSVLKVFKSDPTAPWTWSPTYTLVSRSVYELSTQADPRFSLSNGLTTQGDSRAWQTLDVVRKNEVLEAYPEKVGLPSIHDTSRRADST